MKIKTKTKDIMKFLPTFILIILVLFTSSVQAATYVWETVGLPGFSAGSMMYTSLAIDNSGTPYVAYRDSANGAKATVMKFNGTSWELVGSAGFSEGQAEDISLAIDDNGTPYLAYRDWELISLGVSTQKATVMKFDGTSWVTVGSRGFSAGDAYHISLAIYNRKPYVAYIDYYETKKATVMKFDGSQWVTVGSAGFSAGEVTYTSLAIDNNGMPYVAYRDYGNSLKATVMKFNGTNWENVGTPGFSAGGAYYTSLAIYSGTPYVAYRDGGNSGRATVMKFNGTNWENVGTPGFSAGSNVYSTSLAIDNNGTPYVAYQDSGNSYNVMVMKFNGTEWVNVGSSGFSSSFGFFLTSLAIDDSGTPYVAYQDSEYLNKATVMKGGFEIDLNDTSLSRSVVSTSETDVGTFSPTGGSGPFLFSFQQSGAVCTGTNGAGNGFFTINGNTLQRKPTTPLGSYQVCVQVVDATTANDQHAYTINVVNALDTLSLDNLVIPDDQTNVGDFNVTGGTAPMVYTLEANGDVCNGTNGADNASFSISGTTLQRENGTIAGTYDICAQAEDTYGLTTQKAFTITVSASPSNLTLSNTSVIEIQEIVGTLDTVDGKPLFTYSLETSGSVCTIVNGADNSGFEIQGNALKLKMTTLPGDYDVCIQTLDEDGSTFQRSFIITVTANNLPSINWNVEISSTHLIDGDGPDTVVGSMKANISGVTYALVDQDKFTMTSNFRISTDGKLSLTTTVDYNIERNYPLRILATAPDGSKKYVDVVIKILQDGTKSGAMGVEDSVKTKGFISIDVLSNDILSSGATRWDFHEIIEYPQHGTAEIGSVVYTPDVGYSGEDIVSYRACDNLGFCITALVTINVEAIINLPPPNTGFAPGRISKHSSQMENQYYLTSNNILLEIPSLGIQTDIIGVPITNQGWDLTWLGKRAGWLEGSAFPSGEGNSVLTGHVYDENGLPGLFVNLHMLHYNDRIFVNAWGQRYIYAVRSIQQVKPDNLQLFEHEDFSWLTLVTCRGYDEQSDSYIYRIVVRAILVAVE